MRTEDRVNEIFNYVKDYISDCGYSPSLREIAKGCYTNTSTVMDYLAILQARGVIRRNPKVARSIAIVKTIE